MTSSTLRKPTPSSTSRVMARSLLGRPHYARQITLLLLSPGICICIYRAPFPGQFSSVTCKFRVSHIPTCRTQPTPPSTSRGYSMVTSGTPSICKTIHITANLGYIIATTHIMQMNYQAYSILIPHYIHEYFRILGHTNSHPSPHPVPCLHLKH